MKRKDVGLRKKIICIICILILLMSIVLVLISYKAFYDAHINFYHDKALGIVKMLAEEVDGDKVSYYIETCDKDEEYDEMLKHFNRVKENTSGLSYLYIMVPYEDYFVYVLDAYTKEDDMNNISQLGDRFEYGKTEIEYLLPDVKAKSPSTQIVHGEDVGFGKSISVWAPVFDKNGEVAAMIEADYEISGLEKAINNYVYKMLLFLFLAMAGITVIMIKVMDITVINPVIKLTKYVQSYKAGTMKMSGCRFKEDNEIKWLADSFDEMIEKIGLYVSDIERVTAEKERISAELNIATQIQADMLPCIFPPFPERTEIDLYASMTPAKEVGGDFYDFFLVDDNHLALVIADVSGKGVPAALFMVITKTLIKNQLLLGSSPKETLEVVNKQLCENNEAEMFVTVWLGVYEISAGILTAVNAGHEYPILKRSLGVFEVVKDKHGLVLAAMEDARYKEYTMKLEKGDRLFVYTDGVVEATNGQQELFGVDRMITVLNRISGETTEVMLRGLERELDSFAGDEPQFDDITMLVLQINEVKEDSNR